jgi:hypothetical protein
MIGAASGPDPYLLTPVASMVGIKAVPALRSPLLNTGEATGVFVIAGQSNCGNNVDTAYVPTNAAKIDNLDINDGGMYAAADPLLGCTTNLLIAGQGNLFTRFADKVITAGIFARVILIPVGVGGTPISSWQTGGGFSNRTVVAARRAHAVGLSVTAFIWMQGESDTVNGTLQAAYAAGLAQVIAAPRAEGYNAPWFIGKCSYITGGVSAAVQAAQAAAVNGTDIFAGANTDTLTGGTNRQADLTHFNAVGADAAATLWNTAVDAVF